MQPKKNRPTGHQRIVETRGLMRQGFSREEIQKMSGQGFDPGGVKPVQKQTINNIIGGRPRSAAEIGRDYDATLADVRMRAGGALPVQKQTINNIIGGRPRSAAEIGRDYDATLADVRMRAGGALPPAVAPPAPQPQTGKQYDATEAANRFLGSAYSAQTATGPQARDPASFFDGTAPDQNIDNYKTQLLTTPKGQAALRQHDQAFRQWRNNFSKAMAGARKGAGSMEELAHRAMQTTGYNENIRGSISDYLNSTKDQWLDASAVALETYSTRSRTTDKLNRARAAQEGFSPANYQRYLETSPTLLDETGKEVKNPTYEAAQKKEEQVRKERAADQKVMQATRQKYMEEQRKTQFSQEQTDKDREQTKAAALRAGLAIMDVRTGQVITPDEAAYEGALAVAEKYGPDAGYKKIGPKPVADAQLAPDGQWVIQNQEGQWMAVDIEPLEE